MANLTMTVNAEFTLRARARIRVASWCLGAGMRKAAEMLLRTLPANVQVGKHRFRHEFSATLAAASIVLAVVL
jgi:hypothetical protein